MENREFDKYVTYDEKIKYKDSSSYEWWSGFFYCSIYFKKTRI